MSNVANRKLVYILAASHSGSTLLAMLLNSHPDISTAGELKASNLGVTENYLCSCREELKHCPFWKEVSQRMAKQGLAFDIRASRMDLQFGNSKYTKRLLKPLHRGRFLELIRSGLLSLSGSWRRNHVAWQQRNRELIGVISDKNSTQFVVDSSKTGLRLRYLKSIPGLDIHVIRLTRDGRAVTLTYLQPAEFADARKSEMRGGGTGEYRGYGLDMLGAIERWWRSNEEADRAFQSVPETNRLQISYEDLCTETTVVMSRIFSFLGVKDNLSYREFRDNDHHLVGNGMRLDGSSEVQLDDRWRQSLGESDMKVFEDHARDKNMKYGYG